MKMRVTPILAAIALAATAPASAAKPVAAPTRDYLNDKFEIERILDWGDRPVWSPDSKRLVFTRDDSTPGPAYEMDLATRQVRCLTCKWGASGHVGRIYYLNDGSYLIVGPQSLATAEIGLDGKPPAGSMNQLYWMPSDISLPPQPLSAHVFGEVALDHAPLGPNEMRIAWGEYQPKYRLMTGTIINNGERAFLVNRAVRYADPPTGQSVPVTFVETYDFVEDGKAITFFSHPKGQHFNGMYKLDLESGKISEIPHDGQHNETHRFPDERYGLQESNRASDPSGPYRALSGHSKQLLTMLLKMTGDPKAEAIGEYGGKTFDLYVVDQKTGKQRRLTDVSHLGGEAHQSSPAPDGQRIAFSLHGPSTGPFAGKSGLYIGTFSAK